MNNQVQLQVNHANLVQGLRFAFSNHHTVLGELMQNARRAGATKVSLDYNETFQVLTVTDDGCGISDFQKLLTVAESGWNAETMAEDRPFGIGYLSALYAAENVKVESMGRSLHFNTQDALNFEKLDMADSEVVTGTVITMSGVALKDVESLVGALAKGFPIPVYVNGKEMERPHAMDQMLFVKTEIGHLHSLVLHGATGCKVNSGYKLYLQGLPVSNKNSIYISEIIHLDSLLFTGRLPDRDKLVDEDAALKRISKTIEQFWVGCATHAKSVMTHEQFILKFWDGLKQLGRMEVFNDIPLLSQECLSIVEEFPVQTNWSSNFSQYKHHVSMTDIKSGKIKLVEQLTGLDDSTAKQYMYAYLGREQIVCLHSGSLDAGHWIHEHVIDIEADENGIEVVLDGVGKDCHIYGHFVDDKVTMCKSYTLKGPHGEFTSDGEAVFSLLHGFVIPEGENSGAVVQQVYSFTDEHDDFQENDRDEDEELLRTTIEGLRGASPAKTLENVLYQGNVSGRYGLKGKSFTVSFNGEGHLTVTELS